MIFFSISYRPNDKTSAKVAKVAKVNQVNRLVSSPKEIITALHQEFTERLRIKKIRPYFKDQDRFDKDKVRLKINKTRLNKSELFEICELEEALNNLNK